MVSCEPELNHCMHWKAEGPRAKVAKQNKVSTYDPSTLGIYMLWPLSKVELI